MTPIHMAAIEGHADVVKLLTAKIDYKSEYFGKYNQGCYHQGKILQWYLSVL